MCVFYSFDTNQFLNSTHRQDDKSAKEFNITAGAVLHLVLALRGGS